MLLAFAFVPTKIFIKMKRLYLSTVLFISILSLVTICCGQTSQINCLPSDLKALVEFKNNLNDPENTLSSWTGDKCCEWKGIGCDNITGAVTMIDLHNHFPSRLAAHSAVTKSVSWNLSGEISPALLQLKSLQYLDLSSNTFEDISIPKFFGSLQNLRYLNLSSAGFSGTVPSTLGNLSHLEYLDVSTQTFGMSLDNFQWITALVSLKYLSMNRVDLSLASPNWLEMLNALPRLAELHLSMCDLSGSIANLSPVNFTSLAVIDLSFNQFSSQFPDWLANTSSLVSVDLSYCKLWGRIPLGLGDLRNLRRLNLVFNGNLTAGSFALFSRSWRSIEVLDFGVNKVHGNLPANIGNFTSLTEFDLSDNNIEGGIPSSIGSLCKLVHFDVSGNNLNGRLPERLEGTEYCASNSPLPKLVYLSLSNNQMIGTLPDWLGQLRNLEELSLAYNLFEGHLPESLGSLRNLSTLSLEGNKLTGTLPVSLGQLSELGSYDVSFNYLTGTLSELHFANLSKVKMLNLASNSLILNVSPSWIPPFQVRNLDLGSCRLGPSFPLWLESQRQIRYLDLSNASMSGSIPPWFWDLTFNLSLLNVSFNELKGEIPSPFQIAPFADVDLSWNLFEGPIPIPSVTVELFDLSNNRFQGPIPMNIGNVMSDLIFLSLSGNKLIGDIPENIGNMSLLQVLDLSSNINLRGNIPTSIGRCSYLKVFDIGNNKLSGEIPDSISQLNQLQSLHLNDNFISGNLPFSLKNLSSLETLDLTNNEFNGSIPPWFGESFPSLRILKLRSNSFSGEIPSGLSSLSSLQVLDLGENSFIGKIPSSLGGLRSITKPQTVNTYLLYGKYRGVYYEENMVIRLKNQLRKFTKTLSLVTAIDLSGNKLSGDFPGELTELRGLMILNLSRNHITGQIPENISNLQQLASLDLSRNNLSGPVPPSIASMNFLGYLNLSDNDLSGEIPNEGHLSTFSSESYEGNPGLCGAPLLVTCPKDDPDNGNKQQGENNKSKDGLIDSWFYLSVGLGFAVGVLVPYLVMVIRRSWSEKYFDLVDKICFKLLSFVGKKPRHTKSAMKTQ